MLLKWLKDKRITPYKGVCPLQRTLQYKEGPNPIFLLFLQVCYVKYDANERFTWIGKTKTHP